MSLSYIRHQVRLNDWKKLSEKEMVTLVQLRWNLKVIVQAVSGNIWVICLKCTNLLTKYCEE